MNTDKLLGNRYQISEQIGSGGMGDVFRGIDTRTGENIAIKRLKFAAKGMDAVLVERFEREAEALRQLNHPNIVRVLDKLEDHNAHYIVMEYVDNGSLDKVLSHATANGSLLSIRQVISMALEIADALTRAHHLKIIHRDLKPANVLCAGDGTLRLSDFGIAYFDSQRENWRERITQSGDILGTLDYMSPESLTADDYDHRTDIWAFGILIYEMLAGDRPFIAPNFLTLIQAIVTEPVPNLEERRPDAPIALIDLVYRLLQKDPERRSPSMRLVGAELEMILQKLDTNPSEENAPTVIPQRAAREPISDTVVSKAAKGNKLPAQLSPFIGREAEVLELKKLLTSTAIRLVTVLATGGMGKTRLLLELAHQLMTNALAVNLFVDGIYFIELAPLTSVDGFITALSEAIGHVFQDNQQSHRQQILQALQSKKMLLIFDNFEHLLDAVAFVAEIMTSVSEISILTSSRERLNLQGETIFRLSGMDIPSPNLAENALNYSSIKLFLQSARYAQAGFELQAGDLPHVIQICRLLEGLPLGIVLAAAWVDILSIAEIVQEISHNLNFLESEAKNIPERHRSLRAVFEYSWALMNDDEQSALMKLAVFRGGFSRDAAQTVTSVQLRILMTLVNKSLLYRNPATGRYTCHELLRQFAEQALERSGQIQKTRDAHSDYFLNFMYERRAELSGQNQSQAFDQIEAEMENIRAAWSHAIDMKHFAAIQKAMTGLVTPL